MFQHFNKAYYASVDREIFTLKERTKKDTQSRRRKHRHQGIVGVVKF